MTSMLANEELDLIRHKDILNQQEETLLIQEEALHAEQELIRGRIACATQCQQIADKKEKSVKEQEVALVTNNQQV